MYRGFPTVTKEQPFQDHLSGTNLLTQSSVSWQMIRLPGDLNEYAEASPVSVLNNLSRPSFE